MSKAYTIRYNSIITAVSNYEQLMDILKGDAKGHTVETKMSEDMPLTLHNAIAFANAPFPACGSRKVAPL